MKEIAREELLETFKEQMATTISNYCHESFETLRTAQIFAAG